MHIKVFGPGCANCVTLAKRVDEALRKQGVEATVEKVTDYGQIAAAGIMKTPGLMIDDDLVVTGRVPKVDEIAELVGARA